MADQCACGAELPADPPTVTSEWRDSKASTEVCYDCFRRVNTLIDVTGVDTPRGEAGGER